MKVTTIDKNMKRRLSRKTEKKVSYRLAEIRIKRRSLLVTI